MKSYKDRFKAVSERISKTEASLLTVAAANDLMLDQMTSCLNSEKTSELQPLPQSEEQSTVEWSMQLLGRHGISIEDLNFDDFLSAEELAKLESEFSTPLLTRLEVEYDKKYGCDKVDYAAAAISGVIAGLIDAVFVGMPKESLLGNFTDDLADKAVMKFARKCGWNGPKGDADPVRSAIGWLEHGKNNSKSGEFQGFRVKYDQRHSGDVGGLFSMSASNHHYKSLAHMPSLVGLICSVINQFTSTSTFISNGKLVTIDTETFDLQGNNFIAKIYAGAVNWFGHIMSDIAGSSGSVQRGSGVPIPCSELLLFLNIGSFGKDRRTIAEVAVKVFENGYDFRHGAACAIPVLLNELFIRLFWAFKRHYRHEMTWIESIPKASNPSLNRMLLVGHGCLCLIDAADASIRSGGVLLTCLLRCNLIAWARLGVAGLVELNHLANKKTLMYQMEKNRLAQQNNMLDKLIAEADKLDSK